MNLFNKLFSSQRILPNLKPLYFTDSAITKINEHLQTHNLHGKSSFRIRVEYKETKYIVQVGFDKSENLIPQFTYPVPVSISPKDELFLRGFTIEFNSKENSFFVSPDIQVEAYDTPKTTIKKFFTNRFLVSPNSELQEVILEKQSSSGLKMPYFVREIFKFPFVISFFTKENWIQVEFDTPENIYKKEQEFGEFLAGYLETCGYPLIYKNEKLTVEYFQSAP